MNAFTQSSYPTTIRRSFSTRMLLLAVAVGPIICDLAGATKLGYVLVAAFILWLSPYVLFRLLRGQGAQQGQLSLMSQAAGRLGLIYLVLQIIAGIRGFTNEDSLVASSSWGVFIVDLVPILGAVYIAASVTRNQPMILLDWVAQTLMIVCVLNLIFWMLGVQNSGAETNFSTKDDAEILSHIGIAMKRVDFVLTGGVNGGGVTAGITFTYGLSQIGRIKGKPMLHASLWVFFAIAVPFISLLLSDSRGALAFSVLAVIMARVSARINLLLVFLMACGVVYFFLNLDTITDVFDPLGLSRGGGGGDLLTGRGAIWIAAVAIMGFSSLDDFWGYGAYGHFVSGASRGYSAIFKGWGDNPELLSVHNGYLQIILDVGYLGLFFALGFIFTTYWSIARARASTLEKQALAALLNFLVLQAMTEGVLTPYLELPFMTLIAISVTAGRLRT